LKEQNNMVYKMSRILQDETLGHRLWKQKKQNNGEIGKKPNTTNSENLPDYIQPFTYLFNKKKFEILPE